MVEQRSEPIACQRELRHPGQLLAARLEDMRKQSGQQFSQADLHRATGLSVQYLSAVLSGRRRISARAALKLAEFFDNDPMEWLLTQAQWDLEQARSDLVWEEAAVSRRGEERKMSSKYDAFWLKKFEELGGIEEILRRVRSEKRVVLPCPDIRNWGDRRTWSGHSVVGSEGKIGGDVMAHTAALKNLLPENLGPCEAISCRMTASCDLILTVLSLNPDTPAPARSQETPQSGSRPDGSDRTEDYLVEDIWVQALSDPVPLFLTMADDELLARLDDKGFFLSPYAQAAYNLVKDLPHIYVARLKSENWFYFGKSNQPGGRFKRAHAYHLGGLAHELLGTTRSDDQRSHRFWVKAWFDLPRTDIKNSLERRGGDYLVRLKEPVVISFLQVPNQKLRRIESTLIARAKEMQRDVLNRTR